MTNDLLLKVWDRLEPDLQERLTLIIKFHHPEFDPRRRTSFPELEPLLSAMEANRVLFNHTRNATGNFRLEDIEEISNGLLWHAAQWFDELHADVQADTATHRWLRNFVGEVCKRKSTIISFNWDLVLDELLLNADTIREQYGFGDEPDAPMLLKPHGSLNWFNEKQAAFIKDQKVVKLAQSDSKGTWAFTEISVAAVKEGAPVRPPDCAAALYETVRSTWLSESLERLCH